MQTVFFQILVKQLVLNLTARFASGYTLNARKMFRFDPFL